MFVYRTCDIICAADHMVRNPRPSFIFAYCKQSKNGDKEGLGMKVGRKC